jgi:predicted transcriptional regulator
MQTLVLSPAISDLLAKVASRLGQSPDAVAEEAVRHFIAHQEEDFAEKKRAWDAAVQVGLDDVAAGRVVPWNAETRARIHQAARELVENNTMPIASDATP